MASAWSASASASAWRRAPRARATARRDEVEEDVDEERGEDEGAPRERRRRRPLAQHEPDPQRPQHDLQHPDERALRGAKQTRPRHEEQEPRAELPDAEEGQQREIARRRLERSGERQGNQKRERRGQNRRRRHLDRGVPANDDGGDRKAG